MLRVNLVAISLSRNIHKTSLLKSAQDLNHMCDLTTLSVHKISAFKVLSSITICSTVFFNCYFRHRIFLFLWSMHVLNLKYELKLLRVTLTFCLCFLSHAWSCNPEQPRPDKLMYDLHKLHVTFFVSFTLAIHRLYFEFLSNSSWKCVSLDILLYTSIYFTELNEKTKLYNQ